MVVVVVIGWVGLGGKGWVSSIYNCSWVLLLWSDRVCSIVQRQGRVDK